jgi:hypothetical protein
MRRAGAMAALTAVYDGTFAAIREQVADPARLDRPWVVSLIDTWDNHTLPMCRAASRPTVLGRDRGAALILARMWSRSGRRRREWLAETMNAAGYSDPAFTGDLQPPVRRPHPDGAGNAYPVSRVLDSADWEALARDYDVTCAEVAELQVEHIGSGVDGRLLLLAPRRFADSRAGLVFFFHDIDAFTFAGADAVGRTGDFSLTTTPDAALTLATATGDVSLRGRSASWIPEDPLWHRSTSGRAATADLCGTSDPREPEEWSLLMNGDIRGRWCRALAAFLRGAALEIRLMGHATMLHRAEVEALGTALAEVGARTVDALSHQPMKHREAAAEEILRDLWHAASPDLRRVLAQVAHRIDAGPWAAVTATAEAARPEHSVSPKQALADVDFTGGRIRYVRVAPQKRYLSRDFGPSDGADNPGAVLLHVEGSRAGVPVIVVLELEGVSTADVHGAPPTTVLAAAPIFEAGELILPVVGAEPWRVSVAKMRIWRDRALV